jgi:hypothetical protein
MIADGRKSQLRVEFSDIGSDYSLLHALENFLTAYKEEKEKQDSCPIPLAIYEDRHIGVLEATVRYMRDTYSMRLIDIARLLNRDSRTVWMAYSKARLKQKSTAVLGKIDAVTIPCMIFADRRIGPLEAVVFYAHDKMDMKFSEIAAVLKRDYSTIWLSYRNCTRKLLDSFIDERKI